MVISKDFGAGAATGLVWRHESELTVITTNKVYQLPESCVEESLVVMLEGQVLNKVDDNGYNVLTPLTFELKETKPSRVKISVGYLKA
jgi:hypothetical protein